MNLRKQILLLLASTALFVIVMRFEESAELSLYNKMVASNDANGIRLSHAPGFYDEAFDLVISAPTNEIYYTTDGREPDRFIGNRYENPIRIENVSGNKNEYSSKSDISTEFLPDDILEQQEYDLMGFQIPKKTVDKCTIIRAVFYNDEGRKSDVTTASFFVGYQELKGYDGISILSIITDPDNLFGKNEGIYVTGKEFDKYRESIDLHGFKWEGYWFQWPANYRNRGKSWEREVTIQYFESDHSFLLTQQVGLRIQGNATRAFASKSLNLYARPEYDGNTRINCDFWGTGYQPDKMTVFAGGGDRYSKIRDPLAAELCSELSFPKMHYKPCALFLDGEYWGLYFLTEKYDATYLSAYYGIEENNVVLIKKGMLEEGNYDDYAVFLRDMNFLQTADMTEDENYKIACSILDIESTIDYFAAEIYFGEHEDWMVGWNNTALWKTREEGDIWCEDGRWRWLSYDQNGIAWRDYATVDNLSFQLEYSPLINNLCKNDDFRKQFIEKVFSFGAGLSSERISTILDNYSHNLTEPMRIHLDRFFNVSIKYFENELEYIKDFFDRRYDMAVSIFRGSFPDSEVDLIASIYAEEAGFETIADKYLLLNQQEKEYVITISESPVVADTWIRTRVSYKNESGDPRGETQ